MPPGQFRSGIRAHGGILRRRRISVLLMLLCCSLLASFVAFRLLIRGESVDGSAVLVSLRTDGSSKAVRKPTVTVPRSQTPTAASTVVPSTVAATPTDGTVPPMDTATDAGTTGPPPSPEAEVETVMLKVHAAVKLPSKMFPNPIFKADPMQGTIFVLLASFRDVECVDTMENLFTTAKIPSRVFVGANEERFAKDELVPSCIPPRLLSQFRGTVHEFDWPEFVARNITPARVQCVVFEAFDKGTSTTSSPPSGSVETPLAAGGAVNGTPPATLPPFPLSRCQIVTRVASPTGARGPTYSRYVSSHLFQQQDYAMVIDSHSQFIDSWDVEMITTAALMPTKGVLSHYPNGYEPNATVNPDQGKHVMQMCRGQVLSNGIPKLGAHWIKAQAQPVLQSMVAAGYFFGSAQFIRDVPFDPHLPFLFDGEEILYTLRLWSHGWDSYCPGRELIRHHYGREKSPRFWGIMKPMDYQLRNQAEMRTKHFLQLRKINTTELLVPPEQQSEAVRVEENIYGMGSMRPVLEEYWVFAGLNHARLTTLDSEGRWIGGSELCLP